jgi:hypothetical protein
LGNNYNCLIHFVFRLSLPDPFLANSLHVLYKKVLLEIGNVVVC